MILTALLIAVVLGFRTGIHAAYFDWAVLCDVKSALFGSTRVGVMASTIQEACTKELLTYCVDMPPDSLEDSFLARMCLRDYRENLSHECKIFIYEDSPSLVEPCFQEISTFCHDVIPGDNRILACLMGEWYDKLAHECLIAVSEQLEVISSISQNEQAVLDAFLGDDTLYHDDALSDGQEKYASYDLIAGPSGDFLSLGSNSIYTKNSKGNAIFMLCQKIIDYMLEDAKYIESLFESILLEDADDEEVSGLLATITAIDWVFGNVRETHFLRGSM